MFVTKAFTHMVDAAEVGKRLSPCLARRDPVSHAIGDIAIEVIPDFVVEVPLHVASCKKRPDSRAQSIEHAGSPQAGAMTPATPTTKRFHQASSSPRTRSPRAVSV